MGKSKISEHVQEEVVVRTEYPGQSLRVVLVRGDVPYIGEHWPYEVKDIQAELVILSGTRVIIGNGSITVQDINQEN